MVRATSQADSTKSVSANVTVVAPHSVSLSWNASSSTGISYYNVYRGTTAGGPYSLLKNGVNSTSYTDATVQSGSTYFYVTTAVGAGGLESAYSGEASAAIPVP
jgi:fibronectin type 3 domain-containing protein